jgi:hypothetical protein
MPQGNPQAYANDPRYASGTGGDAYTQNVLGGQYLDEGNPYLDQHLTNARQAAEEERQRRMAELNAQALRPTMLGSGHYRQQARQVGEDFARGVSESETSARMSAYEAERARQQEAMNASLGRDAAIWGDLSTRRGQDKQAQAASASASAAMAGAAASRAAAMDQAQMDQAWREAQLMEQARQFDAGLPLQYASALGPALAGYSSSQQGDLSGLAGMIGQQYGQQSGAAQGLGSLLGTQGAQGMQAAGMIPGMTQSGLPWAQSAAGLAGTLAGANATRYAAGQAAQTAGSQLDFARQQAEYESMLRQQQSMDPMAQLSAFLPFLGTAGGLAGGTMDRHGLQAGTPQPYMDSGPATIMGGLGGLMGGLGMMGGMGGLFGGG